MALTTFENYSPELAESIRENESRCDRYEDELGTYLVRLSAQQLSDAESEEATELLKIIGDFERISDHAVNLLAASEELRSKGLGFSATAEKELKVLIGAVSEILNTAERAFSEKDLAAAAPGRAAETGHRCTEGADAHAPYSAHAAGSLQY